MLEAGPLVSTNEARRFLRSLAEVEGSAVDLDGLADGVIVELYRETLGKRAWGRLLHKHEEMIGGVRCLVAHNCVKPETAVVFLHGFASSPYHVLPVVEKYYSVCKSQAQRDAVFGSRVVWILPSGPVTVADFNERQCHYVNTNYGKQPLVGNLYCWWELNNYGEQHHLVRHLLSHVKNKLFTPVDMTQAISQMGCLLDDVVASYGLKYSNIYLCGFSQGATLASEVLIRRKGLLGGVALFSGGPCRSHVRRGYAPRHYTPQEERTPVDFSCVKLTSSLSHPGATPFDFSEEADDDVTLSDRQHQIPPPQSQISDYLDIPIFISHGTRDCVIPHTLGRLLRRRLTSKGFSNVEFESFLGGHEIPDRIVVQYQQWLLRTHWSSEAMMLAKSLLPAPCVDSVAQTAPFCWSQLPGREARFFSELWLRLPRLMVSVALPSHSPDLVAPAPDDDALVRHISRFNEMQGWLEPSEASSGTPKFRDPRESHVTSFC